MRNQYAGTEERTADSVARVKYHSLERGTLTRYLEPGDEINLPADRVEVEALEPDDYEGDDEISIDVEGIDPPNRGDDHGGGPDDPGAAAAAAVQDTDRDRTANGYFELPDNCTDLIDLFLDADIQWARQQVHAEIEVQHATPAAKTMQKAVTDLHALSKQAERGVSDRQASRSLNINIGGRVEGSDRNGI